jgi:inosine-uridine nucleoside N-ribohydrolase
MSAGRRPLLLDVDTGVDDAMAIALALELERHELIAVTTVAGNVPLEYTTPNTLKVLDWLGASTPVYRGMSAPLAQPLVTAGHVHGDDGIGGWAAPDARRAVEPETAPEAIVRLARAHRGEITFAFVGPLTNLAVAFLLEPELPTMVSRLVIMGGAFFNPGNVTPDAEFNIYVDPEAAALVAGAGFRATWIGLDVTHQTPLKREVWDRLAGADDASAVLIREVSRPAFEVRGRDGVHLHDPLAVAVVELPQLVETKAGEVTVDVGPRHRGRTRLSVDAGGTGCVATSVDVGRFSARFERLLAG